MHMLKVTYIQIFIHNYLMYVNIFFCMYVCALNECLLILKPDEGIRCPENEVTDSCEETYECWKLNSVPLQQ